MAAGRVSAMPKLPGKDGKQPMNILIIATFFPPDTAISAVRPYMFAKYLTKMGHQVTVLRSGQLDCIPDSSMSCKELGIRVISWLGEDSPAERFERGEQVQTQFSPKRSSMDALHFWLRKLKKDTVQNLKSALVLTKIARAKSRLAKQKVCIDALAGEHFDVVFATYSHLENIYAGQYAARRFGCKWILDIRDPIARQSDTNFLNYPVWKAIQRNLVRSCDACTAVSQGVAEEIAPGTGKEVIVLYNGYDGEHTQEDLTQQDGILRFVYTGVMYNKRSAEPLFRVISRLEKAGKVDLQKICFDYAGPHFEMIREQAQKYSVEAILVNHGFVSRSQAAVLQSKCDIFLVLTWNTREEKGVLTGKFYEGIRARKPILALVSGEVPDSELKLLNEKYRYGFCCEEPSGDAGLEELRRWILDAYDRKQQGQSPAYNPEEGLFTAFTYRRLTEQLAGIMEQI